MDKLYVIVLVAMLNEETGELITNDLTEVKLVNFVTLVVSFFSWQGRIDRDDEVLLILKSRADILENYLIPAVEAIHPYEQPEVIALPILNGSAQYLKLDRRHHSPPIILGA
jgi:periplasmic divalent cation tolerance protein